MAARWSSVGLALALICCAAQASEEQQEPAPSSKKAHWYQGGQIRLGAFFISNIDTSIGVAPAGSPLGVWFTSGSDIGLADSVSVPRLTLSYRFSRRHRLDFGWYAIDRSERVTPLESIEIGAQPLQAGETFEAFVRTDVYKFAYTWIFHQDEKVFLGLTAGLHTMSFDVGVRSNGEFVGLNERERFTAPLPVLGGRMAYAFTPKLGLVVGGDWFVLDYDAYQGHMAEFMAIVEYRATKHFGFGGGLDSFSLSAKIEDEEIHAEIDHVFRGAVLHLLFYF